MRGVGEGNPNSELLFVCTECTPQENQLFGKMIDAMGIKRADIFIAQDLPTDGGQGLQPQIIVAFGTTAARMLLKEDVTIADVRGKFHPFENQKLLITYHPSELSQNPALKKACWDDLQLVMKALGLKGAR